MIHKITIFGGKGEIGKLFSKELKKKNFLVVSVEKEDKVSVWKKKLSQASLVILSVPIEKTASLVQKIAPLLTSNQILTDFTSVKNKVIPEMQKTSAHLISAHPMFGKVSNIQGQKILLLPVRCKKKQLTEVQKIYQSLGLETYIMQEWEKHDNYMGAIQGLLHFAQISFVETLRNKKLNIKTLLDICSPIYKINFSIACRILTRNPSLYHHILMDNDYNLDFLETFLQKAKKQSQQITEKNSAGFLNDFQKNKEFLQKYPRELQELEKIGNFLIEKIQEANKKTKE